MDWIGSVFDFFGAAVKAGWNPVIVMLLVQFVFLIALLAVVSWLLYKATVRTRLELNLRHKVCEWKLTKVTKAMMTYIHENPDAQPGSKKLNRRATDKLVGEMLNAALSGPQTFAEHAEVEGMKL